MVLTNSDWCLSARAVGQGMILIDISKDRQKFLPHILPKIIGCLKKDYVFGEEEIGGLRSSLINGGKNDQRKSVRENVQQQHRVLL